MKNDEGSGSAEYVVLVSLIAVVLIATVFAIGQSVINMFNLNDWLGS